MKKQIIISAAIFLVASTLFFSCKKKEVTPPETPTPVAGFTWQENGGAVITADSAFWTTGTWGTGIRAYKGADGFFEINWTGQDATTVSAQTLDPTYGFSFVKGSITYTGTTGQTLSITANSSDKLSGTFNVPVSSSSGTITSVTGTFTTLDKK